MTAVAQPEWEQVADPHVGSGADPSRKEQRSGWRWGKYRENSLDQPLKTQAF